jgi:hypothetical protein
MHWQTPCAYMKQSRGLDRHHRFEGAMRKMMSDNLVKRLRYYYPSAKDKFELLEEAADRIEALERLVQMLNSKLERMRHLETDHQPGAQCHSQMLARIESLEAALRDCRGLAETATKEGLDALVIGQISGRARRGLEWKR